MIHSLAMQPHLLWHNNTQTNKIAIAGAAGFSWADKAASVIWSVY